VTTSPMSATLQDAFHFTVLQEHDLELYRLAQQTRQHIMQDGALSAKTKTLMAMLCDAIRNRHTAVPVLATVAREQGATEAEIAETLAVAYWVGGVHALNAGAEAFRDAHATGHGAPGGRHELPSSTDVVDEA
jgi:alkylhydroperoxidase/carboxymuconolactone decarboxylase family protein YurZ